MTALQPSHLKDVAAQGRRPDPTRHELSACGDCQQAPRRSAQLHERAAVHKRVWRRSRGLLDEAQRQQLRRLKLRQTTTQGATGVGRRRTACNEVEVVVRRDEPDGAAIAHGVALARDEVEGLPA